MKKHIAATMLLCTYFLCACSPLNREYSSVAPHSSSYYETEDRSVLRAEGYQDLINDLLLLVANHEGNGTIWLYPDAETADAAQAIEQVCQEVKKETPMGAYAVDYITYEVDASSRNYAQIKLTIGYRRTEEQVDAIVHATDVAALYDLLSAAAAGNTPELAIQVGYYDRQQKQVQQMVEQVRREKAIPDSQSWQVNYYPSPENAGIIEILLHP